MKIIISLKYMAVLKIINNMHGWCWMDTIDVLTQGIEQLVLKVVGIENNLESEAKGVLKVEGHDARRGAGRPPYYSTVEEMEEAIERYFEEADAKKWPYTIPDLAYALGFTSRQSLLNYQNKSIFVDTIKRAKLRIEGQRARQLVQGHGMVAGHIFDLKNNFGWRDQQELAEEPERRVVVQNNVGLVGMPAPPQDLAEWEGWYAKAMGKAQGELEQCNSIDNVENEICIE